MHVKKIELQEGLKIMKKFIALVLISVMVVALITSCSGTPADKENEPGVVKNLKLWMPPFGTTEALDKDFWAQEMINFETENNAKVAIEITPWDNYEEKYLTGISSGNGPDIGYMYMEMISDFIDMKALEPFDSYLTDDDKDNYLYLDKGFVQGKQYMLPIIVGNPRIIVANMDILAKSGITSVPKTWDKFIEVGQQIQKDSPDVYVFLQAWGEPAMGAMNALYYPYLWQAGGDLFNDDGTKAIFNSSEGLKAAQFLYDLKFKYKFIPDSALSLKENDMATGFLNGNVAFTSMSSSSTKSLAETDIKWDFVLSLEDKTGGTFIAADSLVLLSGSKEKELAADMAKFITSGPIMTKFHKELTPYPPIAKDEQYNDDERFKKIFEENINSLHTLQPVKGSFKVVDMLRQNLQRMMMGEMTPQQALEEASTYSEEVLGQ